MTDLSTIKEEQIVVSEDKKTAVRYKVVEDEIDLDSLRTEKENLEVELNMPEPSIEELAELGKGMHPYYTDKTWITQRIKEIDKILMGV
jgi:hypothetical protein